MKPEEIFNIKKGDVVTVTGGGGKTSLIYYLAKKLAKKGRVMITTTTKIYTPPREIYERLVIGEEISTGSGNNIDVIAKEEIGGKVEEDIKEKVDEELKKKLTGPSYREIEQLKKDYDYILIEGDGSKGRSMKGWKENEPCIPPFSTKTIGVASIKSLDRKIEDTVHRVEIFLKTMGLDTFFDNKTDNKIQEKISKKIMVDYFKKGEFHRGSNGENFFFLNGVESSSEHKNALLIGSKINNFYMGSLHNSWIEKPKKIDAVVMASGYSKRFGDSDKLLEKIEGVPVIEYLFKTLKELPFNRIIVVGRKKEIRELVEKYSYEFVENKDAHLGQSESVKLGVSIATGDAIAFFPGDQPFLKKEDVFKIIEKYQKEDEITLPLLDGKPNTPVIFPIRYRDELLKLTGDTGGREVIKKSKKVVKVNFEKPHEKKGFRDIDAVEDIYN